MSKSMSTNTKDAQEPKMEPTEPTEPTDGAENATIAQAKGILSRLYAETTAEAWYVAKQRWHAKLGVWEFIHTSDNIVDLHVLASPDFGGEVVNAPAAISMMHARFNGMLWERLGFRRTAGKSVLTAVHKYRADQKERENASRDEFDAAADFIPF